MSLYKIFKTKPDEECTPEERLLQQYQLVSPSEWKAFKKAVCEQEGRVDAFGRSLDK